MFKIKFIFYIIVLFCCIFFPYKVYANYINRSFYEKGIPELPKVLNQADLNTYYNIYLYAKIGNLKQANNFISKLTDKVLVPYMLYILYSQPTYNASYDELKSWLIKYSDTSVARYMISYINTKYPNKKSEISAIVASSFYDKFVPVYARHDHFTNLSPIIDVNSIVTLNNLSIDKNSYTKQVVNYLRNGDTKNADIVLSSNNFKTTVSKYTYAYYANMLSKAYFLRGKDDAALRWGKIAIKGYQNKLPEASFNLGMTYYRLGQYENAITYFQYVGTNFSDPDLTSQGLYWMSRSFLALGKLEHYYASLKDASKYIYNFYGLLALEELGIKPTYETVNTEVDPRVLNLLVKAAKGRTSLALLQFGFVDWAEQELIDLASYRNISSFKGSNKEKRILEALLYMAKNAHMPALSIKLAGAYGKYFGLVDLAYPTYLVKLQNGYDIDPALLLAIIKKESEFYPGASSSSGAQGLMQISPKTALYTIKKYNLTYPFSDYQRSDINVDLGQKYLSMLINDKQSEGNIIYVLAGYNAGLGNVTKWLQDKNRIPKDPLFFIESIPFAETRNYIKLVLSNYWVYQNILGLNTSTLTLLAQGRQPYYEDMGKQKINQVINQYINQ